MMCVGWECHHTCIMCAGSHSFSPRIELMVEFVDGVTRLELMKKADELKVVANRT